MKQSEKAYLVYIQYGFVAISLILFLVGNQKLQLNIALIGILVLWVGNLLYSFLDIKKRIVFLLFNVSQFIFLVARPVISMFRGQVWSLRGDDAEYFAIRSIYLSFLALFAGAMLVSWIQKKKKNNQEIKCSRIVKYEQEYLPYIRLVAGIMFLITWIVSMVLGLEKVLFMRGKPYTAYFAEFSSQLPYFLVVLSSMQRYFMCIFLATFPPKRISCFVLFLSIVAEIPMLLVGSRNSIVLSCIFAFLYYFIRDVFEDKEKWIGRWERILLIIGTPAAVLFLGIYTYLRLDVSIKQTKIGSVLVDFLYNQGVTFDVLSAGYRAIPYLPQRQLRNYTFGGVIDYVLHGSVAQKFFKAAALPDGNNIINAMESNSLAHNMSYLTRGTDAYLQGNGDGSSYLLETYIDFGYLGLFLFTLILGMFLIYSLEWIGNNILIKTIILVSFSTLFLIPRAEATGWIQFLIYMQFWIPIGFTVAGTIVLKGLRHFRRI